MGKHTPGPWTFTKARTIIHISNGVRPIAEVPCRADKRTVYPEAEANARLIAAAPEMLEALKAFAEMPTSDESPGTHPDHDMDELIFAARAAIAKAEGSHV